MTLCKLLAQRWDLLANVWLKGQKSLDGVTLRTDHLQPCACMLLCVLHIDLHGLISPGRTYITELDVAANSTSSSVPSCRRPCQFALPLARPACSCTAKAVCARQITRSESQRALRAVRLA